MTVLYLVIPCFNEEDMLPMTSEATKAKLQALISSGRIDPGSRALFVDDGSKDKTWSILEEMCRDCELFSALKLSRNRGHQNALMAGLEEARFRCDAAVSMDADLQDDIDAIDGFLSKFEEGCDVVYGVRNKRDTDTVFKRSTARMFYRLMSVLGVETVYDHADYRLMSRRALEALAEYKEVNLFLRGIVPLIGYRSDYVYYDRKERLAGESKYPLKKMLAFAIQGITSFSVRPLQLIFTLGIFCSMASAVGLLYALIVKLAGGSPGWTVIIAALWLMGGIQLVCIGICGEYIGRIYSEIKSRPRYHLEQKQNLPDEQNETG